MITPAHFPKTTFVNEAVAAYSPQYCLQLFYLSSVLAKVILIATASKLINHQLEGRKGKGKRNIPKHPVK